MKQLSHREKKKKIASTIIVGLFVAIISISTAYAALSETLTIVGSGTVKSSNWGIELNYLSGTKTGDASFTTPVVNGTNISYTVNLKKPSDQVKFYFYINNIGDINAELSSILSSTPTCTSSTGNTADASLVCDNLDITISYENGDSISNGDVVSKLDYVCNNGKTYTYDLNLHIMITIKLKDTMTAVPSSNVTISNLKHELIYAQTDKTCTYYNISCFVAGTKVLTEDGYRNIETIKVNDYVYAMNEETNQYELKKVLRKIDSSTPQLYKIYVADNIIETTWKHEIYIVDKGWIPASKLEVGDKLSSSKDIDTTITKIEIEELEEPIPVYNMEVEGHHNYLITEDELLVHNANSAT